MRFIDATSHIYKFTARRLLPLALLICTALGVLSGCGGISDIPDPDTDFYLNDFAEVISAESEEYICTLASALDGLSGAQIVIVTVPDTDGYSIDRYATALFGEWRVGDSEKNNGVMLVMSPTAGEYWIVYGDGLDSVFGGGKLKSMMAQSLEPSFAVGDYDGGAVGIFDAVFETLSKHYGVSPVPDSYDGGTANGKKAYDAVISGSSETGRVFMILILAVVIAVAFVAMIRILISGVLGIGGQNKSNGTNRAKGTAAAATRSGASHHTAERYGASERTTRISTPRGGVYRGQSAGAVKTEHAASGVSSRGEAAQNDRRGRAAYEALRKGSQSDIPRGDRNRR